ncbi:MAG: tyrosine-type recombinase/integrase [Lachnospiraceae bacterium]|nr:tyrosine-type recombinase/integrase [Lachnospiraceae bacterium]
MANKKTVAVTQEEYEKIIRTIQRGFETADGKRFRPNPRLAVILILEANLGLRIGDVLNLKLSDIIKDGNRYRLDIREQKTGKVRTFTVPEEILSYIQEYADQNHILKEDILFRLTPRAVQKQLKTAADYLGIPGISTHSFRKYFATSIYLENGYNIELVRTLLQHSSAAITQKYIGIQQKEVEEALRKHVKLIEE